MKYRLVRAAQLAHASYTGKSHPIIKPQWKASLKVKDVEAHLLSDNTLLIPGSNSVMDYIRYNLRVQRLGKPRLRLQGGAAGISWHQGFLAHAKVVQDWLIDEGHRVSFIIGHSLGAASAQILSAGYRVPAVAFAAPRPCRKQVTGAAAARCLCINRSDDRVCGLPGKFFHLGNVRVCRPSVSGRGMDHSMPHYIRVVNEGLAAHKLPAVWPS